MNPIRYLKKMSFLKKSIFFLTFLLFIFLAFVIQKQFIEVSEIKKSKKAAAAYWLPQTQSKNIGEAVSSGSTIKEPEQKERPLTDQQSENEVAKLKQITEDIANQPENLSCQWLTNGNRKFALFKNSLIENGRGGQMLDTLFRTEVYLNPIFYSLKFPEVRSLYVEAYAKPSVIEDLKYAYLTKKSQFLLEQNLSAVKLNLNQNYYSWMLRRVIIKNPNLLGDSEASKICDAIFSSRESSTNQLKELLLSYMERAQVTAEDINFNPEFSANIIVEHGPDGPYYKILNEDLNSKNKL